MHTGFLLLALLVAASIRAAGRPLLSLAPPGGRRPLALVVLAAPVLVVGFAVLQVLPHSGTCSPPDGWDRVAGWGLLLLFMITAARAVALSVARWLEGQRLLAVCLPLRDDGITSRAALLSGRLGTPLPVLRVLDTDAPLAVAHGKRRPVIVLSRWLLEHLDADEIDAVIAHELAHVARRDPLLHQVARVLSDSTAYLPAGRYPRAVLEAEGELGADALAAGATGRPLAMASALSKIWGRSAVVSPRTGLPGVSGYPDTPQTLLEERLTRLLHGPARRPPSTIGGLLGGAGVLSLSGLTLRLLAMSGGMLPLACHVRPY